MKESQVFDEFVEELQSCSEKLPDHRKGENIQYEIKDAVVSAFGVFDFLLLLKIDPASSFSFIAHFLDCLWVFA